MISRTMLRAIAPEYGDPWEVAIASMLAKWSKRPVLQKLLHKWPDASHLCRADANTLEAITHLHRNRARQLIRFSSMWLGDGWEDFSELPGVNESVIDAIKVFIHA